MGKRKRQKRTVRRLGAFLGAVVAEAAGNAVYRGLELLSERMDHAKEKTPGKQEAEPERQHHVS